MVVVRFTESLFASDYAQWAPFALWIGALGLSTAALPGCYDCCHFLLLPISRQLPSY